MQDPIKKDELTAIIDAAEMRAMRLKRIRNLANLSRDQMCDDGEIKRNTLIGWECARFGGLTINGAIKVLARITKEGVHCTLDWLMEGQGSEPSVNPLSLTEMDSSDCSEEAIIASELTYFKSKNINSTSLQMNDDLMLPYYQKGDWVAGKKRMGKNISSIIGKNCIVEIEDGRILLRNVRESDSAETYTLICTNLAITDANLVMANVKLVYAAPVIWHRKSDS